ncbi:hypothetical protein Gasu_52560 isoform 1 [Galdieria sulphuraria]|uniref:Transmembrane protein n=1 Tax=Galdieria sulphuraria TaxID=130081 RepID=M2XU10_GALSU|nr:hypothetical protein Gasu_52560 isoform 1 [Galdieria sulphuraria]EME27153.1 hypothetical protein isoform 1 [Galdieria sulphuraria]|eukprot:XP_005703673.1 hypothetical protein isoform 1 [Galdieria sulphuraria]
MIEFVWVKFSSEMTRKDCFHIVSSSSCFISFCSTSHIRLSLGRNDSGSTDFPKKRYSCPRRRVEYSIRFLEMKKAPSSKPPLNVPSGILLGVSCVLAIAFVGSIFELSSGHPQYGRELTSVILVSSLPSFLFLFYAAIQKGKDESNTSNSM